MKILIVLIIIFLVYFILGINNKLNTVTYNISSPKIKGSIKIALVTDLHSCDYKDILFNEIEKHSPDVILMAGDIIDDRIPFCKGIDFLKKAGNNYPSYYVTGNHEQRIDDKYEIKKLITSNNICVLDGIFKSITINKNRINLFGLSDYEIGEDVWTSQIKKFKNIINLNEYNILLSHRPEQLDEYFNAGFDLSVAGHAHGGQWRIPKVLNGLYSPNQGIFPKYAGGIYNKNDKNLVVSRGLAKETTKIPRLFNPPELVIININ